MLTTPAMSLIAYNQLLDPYNHQDVLNNWLKVDQHNHSQGQGIPIPTAGIQDGAITLNKFDPSLASAFQVAQDTAGAVCRTYIASDPGLSTVNVPLQVSCLPVFDPFNNWNDGLSVYEAPSTGFYLVTGSILYQTAAANSELYVFIYQNGVLNTAGATFTPTVSTQTAFTSAIINCNIGDQIGLWAMYYNAGSTPPIIPDSFPAYTGMSFQRIA